MNSAFLYVQSFGLCADADYPYTGESGTCQTTCTPVAHSTGYLDIASSDGAIQSALLQSPVVVAVEASLDLQLYAGGVMDGVCGSDINHGFVLTGFGVDDATGLKYWKAKNSWSQWWGEGGYVRLLRDGSLNNGAGQCGMNLFPSIPTI